VKVTTWNVNSIRMRMERLVPFLERRRPDVVLLQETKVADADFPRAPLEALGYHVEAHGQRTYNGVALLSRVPLRDVERGIGEGPDHERRLLAARVGDLAVASVYVPNGRALDDPAFEGKLLWFDALRDFLRRWSVPGEALVVGGDFNVAPEDRDVHDPDLWRGRVHFHPREHEALARLVSVGVEDLFRRFEPGAGYYTWWDYRQLGFPKNRGLRIDLLLGSPAAAARCRGVKIERAERKGKKPSDHAPVTAWFDEDPPRTEPGS
jgi:exodeoxyribonuclease-3